MLVKVKETYQTLFPPRQILLRQNGEVKYLSVSAKLQCSLVCGLALSFIWLGVSSYQNLLLKDEVTLAESKVQASKMALSDLSKAYEAKQNHIQSQLQQIQHQQELLQNIVDSLPESVSPNLEMVEQTDNENHAQSNPIADTSAATTEPLLNVFAEMEKTEQYLAQISSTQNNSYRQILEQVVNREQSLNTAIAQAGFNHKNWLKKIDDANLAQGGPFDQLSLAQTLFDKQQLVAKLLSVMKLEKAINNLPLDMPAKEYYISSRYGYRNDPIHNKPAMHKGIDMAGWIKTKIVSPASGVVKRAGTNGSYGRFIEIDHQNGFSTRYGHLYKLNVQKGQKINKGDVIGLMGSSGRSTSTHLHYEILYNNKQLNPLKFTKVLQDVL